MVRVLTSFIFGVAIAPSLCSTSSQRMPRQPSSAASANPTGPPPTISTGMFRAGFFTALSSSPGASVVDRHAQWRDLPAVDIDRRAVQQAAARRDNETHQCGNVLRRTEAGDVELAAVLFRRRGLIE